MPIYKANGKTYDIPEEKVSSFETAYPDATVDVYDGDTGKGYEIPVSKVSKFKERYPKWSYGKAENSDGTTHAIDVSPVSEPEAEKTTTTVEKDDEWKPTPIQKALMIGGIQTSIARFDAKVDEGKKHLDDMAQYTNSGAAMTGGQVRDVGVAIDTDTGEVVKRYQTPTGRVTTDRIAAEREASAYREVTGGLRRKQDVDKMLDEHIADATQRRSEKFESTNKDAYARKDGEGFWNYFFRVLGNNPNTQTAAVTRGVSLYDDSRADEETNYINAELRILEEAKRLREAQKLKKGDGFWDFQNIVNFGQGVKDVVRDVDTYAGGTRGLHKTLQVLDLKEKAERGEELSEKDMKLAEALFIQQGVESSGDTPHGYNAGRTTAEMGRFMVQMAMNPTSGLGKAIATKAVKKFGEKGAKAWAAKIVGTVAGDLGSSLFLANTLQMPTTLTDIGDRQIGEVLIDEDGIGFVGGDGLGKSIFKGEASAVIENYTEMLGEHFGAIGNAVNRTLGTGIRKIGGGRLLDSVSELTTKIGSTKWAQGIANIERRAQWNGSVGEMLEEEAGIILNSVITGDNSLSDLVDVDQQIDIALGVGLFGGFVSGIKTIGYPIGRYRRNQAVKRADVRGSELLGEDWKAIRESLDEASESELPGIVKEVIATPQRTPEQRKAVLDYVISQSNARGYNQANASERRDRDGSVETQVENAFDYGYDISEPQEMNDAKRRLDFQRQRLASSLSEDAIAEFDEDPIKALEKWSYDHSLHEPMTDYVNAKMVYDGMIQRVRDDVDGRIAQSDAMIDSRVNRETGMVQPATMKINDRKVYIVNGTVSIYEDGTGVDAQNSSESIIIRDAETGKVEFADPTQFLSIDEAIDAETEKEAARKQIIDEIAVTAANNIDGVLSFTPGDSYSILDAEGNQQPITILGNSVDEEGLPVDWSVDIQYPDGTIQSVVTSELQQLVDAASTQRVEQFDNERSMQRDAEAEAARQADQSGLNNPNRRTDLMPDDYKMPYDNRPVRASRYIESENGTGGTLYQDENGNDAIVIAAIDNNNYVGYFREYDEQGNPTNRWSAKFQNGSGMRENHRDMMLTAQELLPAGHELTEHTSVSTDGLRNLANQLKHGYELQYDEQGNVITDRVAVNMMARENDLGLLNYNPGSVELASASYRDEAHRADINARLAQFLAPLGLGEEAITWEDGTLYVDHPILRRADTPQQEVQPTVPENAETVLNSAENTEIPTENRDLGTETVPKTEIISPAVDELKVPVENVQQAADDGFIPIDPEIKPDENGVINIPSPGTAEVDAMLAPEESKPTALSQVPTDQNGEPIYEQAEPDTAWDALVEQTEGDEDIAMEVAADVVAEKEKEYKAAEKALKKAIEGKPETAKGDGVPTMAERIAAKKASKAAIVKARGDMEKTRSILEHWQLIAGTRQRRIDAEKNAELQEQQQWEEAKSRMDKRVRETSEKYRDLPEVLNILEQTDPQSIDEVAAWVLSRYKVLWNSRRNEDTGNVVRAGARQHTGIGEGERRKLFGLFASEANGGRSIENLAEDVFEEACNLFGVAYDNAQALDALIDVIKGATSRSDITNYIVNNRIAQAESEGDALHRYYEETEATDREYHERYGMAEAEWMEFYASHGTEIELTDDVFKELMSNLDGFKADEEYERGQIQESAADTTRRGREESVYTESIGVGSERWLDNNGDAAHGETERGAAGSELVPDSIDEGSREENEITKSTTESVIQAEEDSLRSRIEVKDDDWTEGEGYTPTLKRTVVIDGTHNVTQIDAPDAKGDYTGSVFEYDGKTFGDLREVIDYIDNPQPITTGERIAEAEAEVNISPTDKQKEAGNYKKGHVQVGTFDVTIENPKGSKRSGTDADGKKWESTMTHTYGYIRGTKGVDGDHIDVYISSDVDGWNGRKVFVVDQYNPDGSFDEHKVMLGFNDKDEAFEAYLSNYEAGWENERRLDVTAVNLEDFEKWIDSSKRKTKAFADYAKIKKASANSQGSVADYKSVKSIFYDNQGNPIDENGNLIISNVKSVADIKDVDFNTPSRTIGLSTLPGIVQQVLSTNGKRVIIKKNIFERNALRHDELTPAMSRTILSEALYNTTLYGKNKPLSRPNNWIVINVPDGKGNNKLVVLEVNDNKDNVEIVHWHEVDERGLEKIKRQAEREDGQLLILPSETSEEAGALSGPTFDSPNEKLSPGSERYLTETSSESKGPDLVPTSDNISSEGKDNAFFADNQISKDAKRLSADDFADNQISKDAKRLSADESSDKQTDDGIRAAKTEVDTGSTEAHNADIDEYSSIEDKLTEFALRFKDAGIKIEREMSTWISGQTAESLVAVDVNMLHRACDAAGLDKGNARDFRMMIDRTIPKDLLSEVWRLRNINGRKGESDTPMFSVDGDKERNQEAYNVAKGLVENTGIEVVEVSGEEAQAMFEHNGNDALFHIRTYHGTGAEFDRFDFRHMGSGEGAQAYGWGGYVTEVKGIGKSYATTIGGKELLPKIKKVTGNISQVRQWLHENENYNKYVRRGSKHLKELKREYKNAEKTGDEKEMEFYRGLIELQEQSLVEENHAALISDKYGQLSDYQKELDRLNAQLAQRRHLYTVRIPDDIGNNYLDWDGVIQDEIKKKIVLQATLEGISFDFYGDTVTVAEYFSKMGDGVVGYQLYRALIRSLGSDRMASELLSRAGLTGVKYAADRNNGGRADKKKNYVIFNEGDMKIANHVQFMKDMKGDVYGWTIGSKIYLNRDAINPETPLHEYTHLWDEMVRKENPELWNRGKELLRQTPMWDDVVNDPNYADIAIDEDAVASEVHARITGKDGARLLEEMIERAKESGAMSTAEAVTVVESLKRWLTEMFNALKATLDRWSKGALEGLTIEDFNNLTLRDLAEGMNPNDGELSETRFHAAMSRGGSDFYALRDRAVTERGIVMPGLRESQVDIVEIPRHNFTGTGKQAIEKARVWATSNLVGEHWYHKEGNDGFRYQIDEEAIGKYLSSSSTKGSDNLGIHLACLKRLSAIIDNSVEAEIHADYAKTNGKRAIENGVQHSDILIHRYYGAARIEGKLYRVKTTIKETLKREITPYNYQVTELELLISGSETSDALSNSNRLDGTKLLKGVEKSYDAGVKLLEASERVSMQGADEVAVQGQNSREDEQSEIEDIPEETEEEDDDTRYRIDDLDERVAEYKSEYNSTDIVIIEGTEDIEALNLPVDVIVDLKECCTNENIAGVYCEVDKKIYIFANNESGVDIKDVLIHENIHAIIDSNDEGMNEFLDNFMNELSKSTYNSNVMHHMLELVMDNYPPEEVPNEYLAYMIQYSESNPKLRKAISDSLKTETLEYLNKNILDRLYGEDHRERRKEERDSRARREEISQDNGIDGKLDKAKGEEVLERDGHGAYSDAEVSIENDPWSKAWGESIRTKRQQKQFAERERKRMHERVEALSSVLGLDIEVIEDASTLKDKKQRAKGWYDTKTGKITVVVSNHNSVSDMEATILHEAVAHHGLRQLLGEHFDEFLDKVYEAAEDGIKERIDLLASRNGWNRRVATEEYLAGLAEKTDFSDRLTEWFTKVKSYFVDMLRKVGFKHLSPGSIGDNELRYILWRSYQNLANPGRYRAFEWEAEDVALKYSLGLPTGYREIENKENRGVADSDGLYELNNRFNEELEMYENGELPDTHRFELGMPSAYLKNAGFPMLPISMRVSLLSKKSALSRHPFEASDLSNLVHAIRKPIAIFKYTKDNMRNLIVDVERNGKQFLVGVTLNYKANGIEINSMSGLFPKDSIEWLKWIQDGKAIRIDEKNKVREIINSQRTTNTVESERIGLNLDEVTKIVENFENPAINEQNNNVEGDDDVRFRDGYMPTIAGSIASEEYERAVMSTLKNNFDEAWHDYLRSVKALQDAVAKERGKGIDDTENVYEHALNKSSVDRAELDKAERDVAAPLIATVKRILKENRNLSLLDVERYMNCKHAPERNETIAQKKAKEEESRTKGKTSYTDAYRKFREEDYSGLSALFDPEDTGKSRVELEKEAEDAVKNFEGIVGKGVTDELWSRMNRLTSAALEKQYVSGLLGEGQYKELKDRWDYYVPLRGFREGTAGDLYEYVNGDVLPGLPVERVAGGRKSEAGDIIGTSLSMLNRSIVGGNKNVMKQKLLNLAMKGETELLSVSNQWYEQHADGTWSAVYPDIRETMSPVEVRKEIEDFDRRMELGSKAGSAKRGKAGLELPLRNGSRSQTEQHGVKVSRNGVEYVVWVNGNPKAAQAINGLLNPDSSNTILDFVEKINRMIARNVTSMRPNFLVRNLQRDIQNATVIMSSRNGADYARRMLKNVKNMFSPMVVKGGNKGEKESIISLYIRYFNDSLDQTKQTDRLFDEFMRHGGETGYSQLLQPKEFQRKIEKEIEGKDAVSRGVSASFHAIEQANRCIENVVRFAAYRTSRESGKSILQSIGDAKEASVNFNRKGSGAMGNKLARSLYIFVNPAVQGVYQYLGEVVRNPRVMLPWIAWHVTLGALMPLVGTLLYNLYGGGDDDDDGYFGLQPYLRRGNVCIPVGNEKWLSVPMSQEQSMFYGIGETLSTHLLYGKGGREHLASALITELSKIQPMNLIDGKMTDFTSDENLAGIVGRNMLPTGLGYIADAFVWDEDFTGRKISRSNDFNSHLPEWRKGHDDDLLLPLSRYMNDLTDFDGDGKGLINFNPSRWGYVLSKPLGGLVETPVQLTQSVLAIWDEDYRNMRNYPIVSSVIKDGGSYHNRNRMLIEEVKWWEAHKKVIDSRVKDSRKDGIFENAEVIDRLFTSGELNQLEYLKRKDKTYGKQPLSVIKDLNKTRWEAIMTKDRNKQSEVEGVLESYQRGLVERLREYEEMSEGEKLRELQDRYN